MNVYVTKVEQAEDTNEFAILFPPDLDFLAALNLKHNDLLVWEVEEDKITIRKKVS